MPNDPERSIVLHQVDQARTDFAAISAGWLLLHKDNQLQILWSITAIASLFAIVFILTREAR